MAISTLHAIKTFNHLLAEPSSSLCYLLTFWAICSCLYNCIKFPYTEDSIRYNISNSSGIQIGSYNHMKIEEQNQHISTSPVTEATYMHYEAMGIFGKRNISLVLMYSPIYLSKNHLV